MQELKALESKLSKLAQSVHDIYAQLDEVEAKARQTVKRSNSARSARGDRSHR